mmetsp:Transcript_36675/g.113029  ORF Transcript_36675/g.113029 Transcript_36675/m.113029 type:complete len:260 (-) Transcript_36675:429-1208(-)
MAIAHAFGRKASLSHLLAQQLQELVPAALHLRRPRVGPHGLAQGGEDRLVRRVPRRVLEARAVEGAVGLCDGDRLELVHEDDRMRPRHAAQRCEPAAQKLQPAVADDAAPRVGHRLRRGALQLAAANGVRDRVVLERRHVRVLIIQLEPRGNDVLLQLLDRELVLRVLRGPHGRHPRRRPARHPRGRPGSDAADVMTERGVARAPRNGKRGGGRRPAVAAVVVNGVERTGGGQRRAGRPGCVRTRGHRPARRGRRGREI